VRSGISSKVRFRPSKDVSCRTVPRATCRHDREEPVMSTDPTGQHISFVTPTSTGGCSARSKIHRWRGDRRTGPASAVAGILLMGWIVVELTFTRSPSFFHPIYFAVGVVFLFIGRRDLAGLLRSRREPRHAPR
jgi:hypothetical protein